MSAVANYHTVSILKQCKFASTLVVYACNPSYSGGRDKEDLGSKSDAANSFQDPVSKNPT
jgi:hypothetical protein